MKTDPNHSGLVTDIHYDRIQMKNVGNPILIDGAYCPKSQKVRSQAVYLAFDLWVCFDKIACGCSPIRAHRDRSPS